MTATATTTYDAPTAPPRVRYPYPMGALRLIRDDALGFLTELAAAHGDVVRFRLGPYDTMLFAHPDAVKHVLVAGNHNYDKQTRGYDMLRTLLGNGLLTSEGDFWRRQRRIAQPAFHRQRIAAFGEIMVDMTQQMLRQWDDASALGHTVDLAHEMNALTLRIVAKTLFGSEVGTLVEQVSHAVTVVNRFANKAVTGVLPMIVPTPTTLRARQAGKSLDRIVLELIAQRRAAGDDPGDLLSMLLHARDEDTGEGMDDQQLRDEVLTIFLAGHETTSNVLAWTFYLLSTHPGVERRLRAELDEVLDGRAPTLDDLPRLAYLGMVVKESMRVFPPAWMLDRRAREDDEICGYHVKANTLVLLSQWVTHRHPEFWPNPEGFDPERFTPEAEKSRPRYAYFPFGGGPRQCIGNNFALMEAQLIIATILPRFSPWLVPGQRIVPDPLITLRPRYGMQMGLQRIR